MRRNVWAWAVGIIGILAYFYVFFAVGLYGDMLLQVVYLGQSIYGWAYWLRYKAAEAKFKIQKTDYIATDPLLLDDISPPQNTSENTGLHHITNQELNLSILGGAIGFGLLYWLLTAAFLSASSPFVDAIATTLSLTANIWLARKIIENWLLWIIADIVLVLLFLSKNLYLSAGTYTIFLFLAVFGYLQWKKDLAKIATI
jgi:nicotinamide mononucleotide transporter